MKNKLRIIIGTICVILIAGTMTACNSGSTENTETTKEVEVTTVAEIKIDEATAKEIVFTSLSIQETAAENLTVKFENNTYVIAFDWSGFDYQYTVDASTGEIIEKIFDGDVI